MSLDISVYYPEGHPKSDISLSINWLRNPFGLERWAQDNTELKSEPNLYEVCNKWNYEKAINIDRPLFKQVVDRYWEAIQKLELGYFFFDLPSFIQFVAPHYNVLPMETSIIGVDRVKGAIWRGSILGIPMEHFRNPVFHMGPCTLDDYKRWFGELVEIAELLQDPDTVFYCSN